MIYEPREDSFLLQQYRVLDAVVKFGVQFCHIKRIRKVYK